MRLSRIALLIMLITLTSGLLIAQHSQVELMQKAGAAFLGLRADLGADAMDTAKIKAHQLVEATQEIEAQWTLRNLRYEVDDAVEAARNAHRGAVSVAMALDKGDVEAANAALQATVQGCGGCHTKYRPKQRGN